MFKFSNNRKKYSIVFKNTTISFRDSEELYNKLKSIAIDSQEIYEWINRYNQIIATEYIDTINLVHKKETNNRKKIFEKNKIIVSCLQKLEKEEEENNNLNSLDIL